MNSANQIPESQIALFVSPVSHRPLKAAPSSLVEKINQSIGLGILSNRQGQKLEKPIENAYLESGQEFTGEIFAFPVVGSIVILIAAQAIEVTGFLDK